MKQNPEGLPNEIDQDGFTFDDGKCLLFRAPRRMNPLASSPSTRVPRCLPALAALLTAALLLTGLHAYVGHRLKHGVLQLAALNLPENTRGTTLQHALFARARSLPIYGSSELDIDQPTRADLLFHGHPRTGFQAFVIGQPGDRCLVMLQEIAALGEAVRGKRLAIFLSPPWFLPPPAIPGQPEPEFWRVPATFSPLQTGRCLLGSSLPAASRRRLALSLLPFDEVIRARSPLLHQALLGLIAPTWAGRCRWLVVRPLLALQTAVLAEQDFYHQLELLRARPRRLASGQAYVPRHKFRGWTPLVAEVTQDWEKSPRVYATPGKKARAAGLPVLHPRSPPGLQPDRDADFLRRMAAAREWADLDLLLRTLRELGARPLLINQPINGLASDRQGVTPGARRQYYDRVAQMAADRQVPLRDFSGHEEDPAFFQDGVHPSAKAWILYDQALAEFYLGKHG